LKVKVPLPPPTPTMNPALTILILTVPVCALDCVDTDTSISVPANMTAPNFMTPNKRSIVALHPAVAHVALLKVREFSRPVEGALESPVGTWHFAG